jgi:SAM-dependent methyltransferase
MMAIVYCCTVKTFSWKVGDITEWLNIEDAVLAHRLSPIDGVALEIGTWKGGWILTLLFNGNRRRGIAIDPYPNLDYIRDVFVKNSGELFGERVKLFDSLDSFRNSVNGNQTFDIIHLDGEHSQAATEKDLNFALECLKPDGLLIVDDFFYHDFPGVTAGVFSKLPNSGLSPFLFSEKKLYLCKTSEYETYYAKVREILQSLSIAFFEDQNITGKTGPYKQSNSIYGFSLIIIDNFQLNRRKLYEHLNIKLPLELKKIITSWTPPIVMARYRRWRNRA